MEIYNDLVVRSIEGDMNRRPRSNRVPMLLGVAMPGTINKPLNAAKYVSQEIPLETRQITTVVGQISFGTVDFMKHALSYATITRMGDKTDVRIDPIPINVRTPEDVSRLAQKLLHLLSQRDPDVNYVYDRLGQLPVLKPST